MKNYYLFVRGIKVEVTEEVYKKYWIEANRERYLVRLDRQHQLLHFSDYDQPNDLYINHIADKRMSIEKQLIVKERIIHLHQVLAQLVQEERELINALYYDGKTLREVAEIDEVSPRVIMKRRNNILKKLKEILDK